MRRLSAAGPAIAILALFVGLAAWSWDGWADVLVDFGRELYVPWRISEGEVLYRDIAHFNGPLSQYWNALLLLAFGNRLHTLELANLAILLALVTLNHVLLRRIAGSLAATVASLAQVGIFSFQSLMVVGNFNWVAPSSHELTHGIALATLAIWLWVRWHERGGNLALAGVGVAAGATLLTKAEAFLALACALAVALAATGRRRRPARAALVVTLGAAGVVVAAVLLLALAMPASEALRGTLGGLAQVANPDVNALHYYRMGMGLDRVGARLGIVWGWAWRWGLVYGSAAALDALAGKRFVASLPAKTALVGLAAGVTFWWLAFGGAAPPDFRAALRPLPFVLLALLVGSLARAARGGALTTRAPLLPVLSAFGLALLAKMLLFVRLERYGFALPMPGTILVVAVALGPAREALARGRGSGLLWSGVVLGSVAAAVTVLCRISDANYARKTFELGVAADRMRADPLRGAGVDATLQRLADTTPDGSTLAVVPEGVTINWYLQRRNPTGFLNFMPPELLIFGEQRMIDAFERAPPDYVVVVHKHTPEYGMGFFGRDYGARLMAWIRQRYERRDLLGYAPLEEPGHFGVEILAKRP